MPPSVADDNAATEGTASVNAPKMIDPHHEAAMPPFFRFSVTATVMGLLILAGCNGGDGSSPSGTSTVQGNVSSFSIGNVSFVPPGKPGFLAAILDILVPRAEAAVGGVGVRMMGTDLSTSTDDNGYFIMSGAPSGDHQMRFMYNEETSTVDINVPENGTVTMGDIRCVGQQAASVGHMNVQMNSNMGSSNSQGSGGMGMNGN